MAHEIERKFLVKDSSWKKQVLSSHIIVQGYLNPKAPAELLKNSPAQARKEARKEAKKETLQEKLERRRSMTVRVRMVGNKAFLTVKSRPKKAAEPAEQASPQAKQEDTPAPVRQEFEYSIPLPDAKVMLEQASSKVEKTRHIVPMGRHRFEVDEFKGENAGLVMAEIELTSPSQYFPRPAWLGEEVTFDRRFLNENLASVPYKRFAALRTRKEKPSSPKMR